MASEPITIFSRIVEPAAVLAAVRERFPHAVVIGEGATWSSITVTFGAGRDADVTTLTLLHDREYYAGPGWATQRSGMQGYFQQFSADPQLKARAIETIGTFRFALATRFDPDYEDPSSDPRFAIVCGVTQLLDGVIFTPSSLRDAAGRVLFGASADELDDDAEWPRTRTAHSPAN